MEVYKVPSPDTRDPLQRALERIELCQFVIRDTHYELELPENPEHKADLLLAVEALASEALELLHTARLYAWGRDSEEVEDL